MKPWTQEAVWVRRNDQGVIVGVSDKLPDGDNFIPTVSTKSETKKEK